MQKISVHISKAIHPDTIALIIDAVDHFIIFKKPLFTFTDLAGNFGPNNFVVFVSFDTTRVKPFHNNHLE